MFPCLAILIALCAFHGFQATTGLSFPPDVDSLRDAGAVQTIVDRNWFGDPIYVGEWRWYPPLVPFLAAIASWLVGAPSLTLLLRVAPWFNLLTPLAFFVMSARLLGKPAALMAVAVLVLFNGAFLAPSNAASYTPWPLIPNFALPLFFATVWLIAKRGGGASLRRRGPDRVCDRRDVSRSYGAGAVACRDYGHGRGWRKRLPAQNDSLAVFCGRGGAVVGIPLFGAPCPRIRAAGRELCERGVGFWPARFDAGADRRGVGAQRARHGGRYRCLVVVETRAFGAPCDPGSRRMDRDLPRFSRPPLRVFRDWEHGSPLPSGCLATSSLSFLPPSGLGLHDRPHAMPGRSVVALDLPLNFHPVAIRVSAVDTPFGVGRATGRSAEPSASAARGPVAVR